MSRFISKTDVADCLRAMAAKARKRQQIPPEAVARVLEQAASFVLLGDSERPLPPQPLTKRQSEILGFIRETIAQERIAPSQEEIAAKFNYNSLSTVHEHLSNIERKGHIRVRFNCARSIELVRPEVPSVDPDEALEPVVEVSSQ